MIETINKLLRVQKQLVQEYGRNPRLKKWLKKYSCHRPCAGGAEVAQQRSRFSRQSARAKKPNFGDFIEDRAPKIQRHDSHRFAEGKNTRCLRNAN